MYNKLILKRKKIIYSFISLLFLIVLSIWFFQNHFPLYTNTGFGIYLLDDEKPIISNIEIISYNKNSHEIKITQEGIERINNLALEVPINGLPFILKVNNKQVYKGAFWSPISSIPSSGIIIEAVVKNETLKIQIGYPNPNKIPDDPRNNLLVFEYFQKVGKLIE